tara:strand:- start:181464 stop:181871 length:408 start_codon:yes stop_codon:yes gene_type:complete
MKHSYKVISVLLLLLITTYYSSAQTRSTKETKVLLIVDSNATKIIGMELFDKDKDQEMLLKKYPNSLFYLGLLKGNYELKDELIIPKSGAIITMYTNKEIFSSKRFLTNDEIFIGNVKTTVVSEKKGEVILKTQQ